LAEEEKKGHHAKLTMGDEELQTAVAASLSGESASLAALVVAMEEVVVAVLHAQLADAEIAQAKRQQVAAEEALYTLRLPADVAHYYYLAFILIALTHE
jgi:hypothetical protein